MVTYQIENNSHFQAAEIGTANVLQILHHTHLKFQDSIKKFQGRKAYQILVSRSHTASF